ncbi:YgaP family membrane protein [Paraferrimonas sedimenticola]|uniref:YgaP family membrane protein n=1 Tax=Paraferrimonas sedimenticola TaxID=375674 RepID=UPI0032AEB160
MVAGSVLLLSLALTIWVDPIWVWLSVFVALNQIQSAFSGWCPMMWILEKLGLKPA